MIEIEFYEKEDEPVKEYLLKWFKASSIDSKCEKCNGVGFVNDGLFDISVCECDAGDRVTEQIKEIITRCS